MSGAQYDLEVQHTILLVNQARRALELPSLANLPRGRVQTVRRCPVARSFPRLIYRVDPTRVIFLSESHTQIVARAWGQSRAAVDDWYGMHCARTPSYMASFVTNFDQAAYPQYVEPPDE